MQTFKSSTSDINPIPDIKTHMVAIRLGALIEVIDLMKTLRRYEIYSDGIIPLSEYTEILNSVCRVFNISSNVPYRANAFGVEFLIQQCTTNITPKVQSLHISDVKEMAHLILNSMQEATIDSVEEFQPDKYIAHLNEIKKFVEMMGFTMENMIECAGRINHTFL
ncbi:hypothetical protein [Microcystis phage Mel-JY01]